MGLLPFSRCDPVELPVGCEFLVLIGEALLTAGLVGLAPYLPPTEGPCADPFSSYVSMGPPVAEFYDALSVHLVSYGQTPESTGRLNRIPDNPPGVYPMNQAVWRVSLWENQYPAVQVEGDEIIYFPTPEAIHAVNRHVYAHGIAAYDATQTAIYHGGIRDDLPAKVEKVTLGTMFPLGPQGMAVGWAWDVVTEIAP